MKYINSLAWAVTRPFVWRYRLKYWDWDASKAVIGQALKGNLK